MKKTIIFALVLTACSTSKNSNSSDKSTKDFKKNESFKEVEMNEKKSNRNIQFPGSIDTTQGPSHSEPGELPRSY